MTEKVLGEIRSTIDLMMERTRGMTLSAEEKDEVRRDELAKKARGFRVKLLEVPSQADEILASIQQEPEADRPLLESLIWQEMIDSLPADHSALKHLDIMMKLPRARDKGPLLEETRSDIRSLAKTRSQDRKKQLIRERKRLASLGISGTAVVPKLAKEAPIDPESASRLEKLKDHLRRQIQL